MSLTVLLLSSVISFIIGLIGSYLLIKMVLVKTLLDVEFRKGLEEGEKRAMGKFAITYQPIVEITENFLKRTADVGYMMQMFFNGLPFGDPMKRITNHEEKFKDDNLKYLVDSVTSTLNNIMLMADPIGIPVKVNEKPKIEKKSSK